jgi:enolase-phosphatase E1
MFPFARRELQRYLDAHWDSPALQAACDQIGQDAGHPDLASWAGCDATDADRRRLVRDEVHRLMDGDVKATGLKQLQGLVWQQGFIGGELRAHLYDDVFPAIEAWSRNGLEISIYSSGSIAAQKLFFGHTIHGDLLRYFRCHYDTTTGAKYSSESYRTIALDLGLPPNRILFVSDVVAELDAARSAEFQTVLSSRPDNPPITGKHEHPMITTFAELALGQ